MRGEVVAVESVSRGMFGTFVTYMVRVESGVVVPVGNGHLVLEPVNS